MFRELLFFYLILSMVLSIGMTSLLWGGQGTSIYTQAERLFKEKKYSEVTLLLWKKIENLDKNSLFLLAQAHEKENQFSEMIRVTTLMIGKNEKDFQAFAIKGRALMGLKNEKEALEAFKKSAELNPKYRPAYDGLSKIYDQRANFYELRILFEDMLTTFGPDSHIISRLCEINTKDGVNTQALRTCNLGIDNYPSVASNYVNKGLALKQQGETDQAIQVLKNAAVKFPGSESAQYSYANLLEDLKNFIEAFKFYKATVSINSKNELALMGLARSAVQIRNFEVAYEALHSACEVNRKNVLGLNTILRGLKKTQFTESEEHWINKLNNLSDKLMK